ELCVAFLEIPQQNARIYRTVNFELATGKDLASVDEHWMIFAKFTLNVLQRFLVSRMNRLVGQEGDKGYFLGLRSHLQYDTYPWTRLSWKKIRLRLPRKFEQT